MTNNDYYETIPSGNASLVFLPGNHSLPIDNRHLFLDFIDDMVAPTSNSISFTAYKHNQPTVIKCERAMNSSLNSGVYLSAFKQILLADIQFENCALIFRQNEALLISNAVFNTTLFDVRSIASVSISDSDIMMVSDVFCSNVEQRGLFYSNNSHVTLTNVTLVVPNNNFACDNPQVVVFNNGVLEIAGCEFSGKAVHVVISAATMNVLGVTQFGKGINAILAVGSTVNIDGNVRFINNTASLGAAIYLSRSHVTIADNATVLFQDNHATYVGGAIFSPGGYITDYVTIGQPTVDPCQIIFSPTSNVKFINNTAESGGSAMYGITISRLVCDYTEFPRSYDSLSNVLSIEPNEPSAVSSYALRVCICPDQSTPDCLVILPDQNLPHLHYSIYPGQEFFIHAAIVGFNFAMTGGSVYAQFLNSNATLALGTQKSQVVNHTGCALLRYTVLSDQPNETLVLTTKRRRVTGFPNAIARDIRVLNKNINTFARLPYSYFPNPQKYYDQNNTFATNQTDNVFRLAGYLPDPLQDVSVFISLTLIACPLGSTFSQQSQSCRCDERFLEHNLTCNISGQTVQRSGTTWIKLTFGNNSIDEVIVHQPCPFDYCKQDPVDVPFNDSNAQCAHNRAGTLCGACKPNFSLTLGGSQCLPNCSNRRLSLLIPFALAGFALVFFIKILNLTVSQGTINGLIFYANIIAATRPIIFPQPPYNNVLSFLSVFISWLNLDLGIETCFIKGLDGYWKTWLQFVFPFYVWAIAGAIILVSRYSLRATKLFGENSVSVLATLFFLSYAKLLRSTITIFSSTTLSSNTTSSTVWAFDGNVKYLASKHIPLFLFALAIVLLLWLPYTAVLLSAQWLRTQSHHKGLRWLKPFLDAYYGPFKDKHHYWVGVLLVVRGVLFIFFAAYFASTKCFVSLFLVTVSSIFLAVCISVTGRQYKKIYLSALESSFFLNLGVLAAGTLYIKEDCGNLEALVTISIGITFVQFVGIVTFHSYYFVIVPLRMWRRNSKSKEPVRVQRWAAISPMLSRTFVMKNKSVPSTDIYLSRLHSTTSDPTRPDRLILALNKGSSSINPSRSESFEILTNAAAREAKGARSRSEAAAVLSSDLAPLPPDHQQVGYDPPRYFAAKTEAEFETVKL